MVGSNDGDAVEFADFINNSAEASVNELYSFDGFFQISRVRDQIRRGEIGDENVVFSGFESAQKFIGYLETCRFGLGFIAVGFRRGDQNTLFALMFEFNAAVEKYVRCAYFSVSVTR